MTRYWSAMEELQRSLKRQQESLNSHLRLQRMYKEKAERIGLMDIANERLRMTVQQQAMTDVLERLSHTITLEEIVQQQKSTNSFIASIKEQQERYASFIEPHRRVIEDLSLGTSALLDAAANWKTSIDASVLHFHEIGLLGRRDAYLNRLMAPSRAYSSFIEQATGKLDALSNPAQVLAASSVMKLVENQYVSIAGNWSILPAPIDDETPSEEPPLTGPFAQLDDAVASVNDEAAAEPEAMMRQVQSIRCVETARKTLESIYRCNEVIMSAKQIEIFKPTTRFTESCSDLPWLLAVDKKSFGDFIDCLYFIFYEGPGKDKLRFLREHGGVLDSDDCDFIWCLKHLRNKYSRHDPDHGKPPDIKKSWEELQRKWEMLGLEKAPFAREHFLHIQESLIKMAQQFINTMLVKMVGNTVQ